MANDTGTDNSFKALQDLLDIDKDQAEDLLSKLDVESLIDLWDAVANEDRDRVREIVQFVEDDDDLLIANKKSKDKAAKAKPPAPKAVSKTTFVTGDLVQAGKERGHIRHADAPGNTVVVEIKGKLKVFDRKDVKRLKESVVELPPMFDIRRMQALAGLAAETPSVEVDYVAGQDDEPVDIIPDEPKAEALQPVPEPLTPSTQVHALLTQIEGLMPEIKLSDLSAIRRHLSKLQMSMNESFKSRPVASTLPRKRKD